MPKELISLNSGCLVELSGKDGVINPCGFQVSLYYNQNFYQICFQSECEKTGVPFNEKKKKRISII